MLQPISPNFSRGITTALGNATQNVSNVGDMTRTYLLDKERAADKEYQRGREKVQDERATTLWNEQQAEKDRLANAGLLSGAMREAEAARTNVGYNKALADWTASGMTTPAPVIQDYPQILGQQAANINVGSPSGNVGGGGAIFKNVARTVTQPSNQVAQGPQGVIGTTAGVNAGVSPKASVTAPATAQAGATSTSPEFFLNGGKDSTNAILKLFTGGGADIPGAIRKGAAAGYNKVKGVTDALFMPGITQARDAIVGSNGTKLPQGAVKDLNVQAPLREVKAKVDVAAAKADKILTPTTPKQVEQSARKVSTIMDKVVVGSSGGGVPKVTQSDAAVLDKIFAAVDPQAQTRQEAKGAMESMLFSLGLNPKQVKEYADTTVESIYGDGNDPIKLAIANAKANAYGKNIENVNDMSKTMYTEGKADARHTASLAESRAGRREARERVTLLRQTADGSVVPYTTNSRAEADQLLKANQGWTLGSNIIAPPTGNAMTPYQREQVSLAKQKNQREGYKQYLESSPWGIDDTFAQWSEKNK